ncbi:RAN protein kinase [Puccinia triticina 1-1 BBBD Race 1]|uniref:Protein kinase domain-containing protein n=1 Tax=Puccinia triticina (isolate 1-1 / race 1 (BBBD)) TaxID=630390 RepID=A0A0C4F3Q5_PUCT1|nr:RAN protein kinase [Puccinia triticina 1-1 BBBD Race 1]
MEPSNPNHYHIPGYTIRLDLPIASGAFGVVYRGESVTSSTGTICAVKVIPKTCLATTLAVHREILHHSAASPHPDVLTLNNSTETATCGFLVLPYIPNGTLSDQIYLHRYFIRYPAQIALIFFKIVSAVSYCHNHGIAHRDIKPANILCSHDDVYLADFGLPTTTQQSDQFGCGTWAYMSPECLGGFTRSVAHYDTFANNVWSLGVLLINLIHANKFWLEATGNNSGFCEFVLGAGNILSTQSPADLLLIMNMCTAEEERIPIDQVLNRLILV